MPPNTDRRVLVVEDDDGLRRVLARLLREDGGFQVLEAATAEEGRRRLLERPTPDVVACDIRLPDESGEELLAWTRERGLGVPFVLMTAFHTFERAVEAYRLGAVRYLVKPFDLREFLQAVEGALEIEKALSRAGSGELVEPMKGWVEITSPSTAATAERLREFVAALAATALSHQEVNALRLAVEEMVQNAIEWGNRSDPRRDICVAYAMFRDRVLVMVSDQGEGFDPEAQPDPTQDPVGLLRKRLEAGKRIGGYGIHLTREMVDEVIYSERGNTVMLTKYFGEGKKR